MAKFVITHGLFKHASLKPDHPIHLDEKHPKFGTVKLSEHAEHADNGFLGPSADPTKPNVLELADKDAERMDPGCTAKEYAGHCLKPFALHDAEVKAAAAGEAAKKAELEKSKAAGEAAKKAGGAK